MTFGKRSADERRQNRNKKWTIVPEDKAVFDACELFEARLERSDIHLLTAVGDDDLFDPSHELKVSIIELPKITGIEPAITRKGAIVLLGGDVEICLCP